MKTKVHYWKLVYTTAQWSHLTHNMLSGALIKCETGPTFLIIYQHPLQRAAEIVANVL